MPISPKTRDYQLLPYFENAYGRSAVETSTAQRVKGLSIKAHVPSEGLVNIAVRHESKLKNFEGGRFFLEEFTLNPNQTRAASWLTRDDLFADYAYYVFWAPAAEELLGAWRVVYSELREWFMHHREELFGVYTVNPHSELEVFGRLVDRDYLVKELPSAVDVYSYIAKYLYSDDTI